MLSAEDRPALNKSVSDGHLRPDQADQPDLNNEVATLSAKLINAINHQTKLDDSLAAARHELQQAKARIAQLETANNEHEKMRAKGLLVEKTIMDSKVQELARRLKEEGVQRGKAEKDKRTIETELENLTTALFDEANKMVSAARKERDAIDRRNQLLREQLKDTEGLLASHQEQLSELKSVMQQISSVADNEATTSTPPTPAFGGNAKDNDAYSSTVTSMGEDSPCPPTSLAMLRPVLRHDIGAYQDFCELLHAPKSTEKSSTRLSSGSLSQVMGMGISLASPNQSPIPSPGFFGRRKTDSATHSPSNSTDSTVNNNHMIAQGLKETRFFKRVLVEDIEPTLRLDCAPGISWYARRGVLSSIIDGSLVIEPTPTTLISSMLPCAMCGENRRDELHVRTHRMRTNENKDTQTHTLCPFCVTRVRSVCDFLGFLRTLKEGLWKCENDRDEKNAWEESVKLRECMFWNRIGGGVVPNYDSRRTSLAQRTIDEEKAPETPPRTPELKGHEVKLDIPRKRNSLLTPEKRILRDTDLPQTAEPLSSRGKSLEVAAEEQILKETQEAENAASEDEASLGNDEGDVAPEPETAPNNVELPASDLRETHEPEKPEGSLHVPELEITEDNSDSGTVLKTAPDSDDGNTEDDEHEVSEAQTPEPEIAEPVVDGNKEYEAVPETTPEVVVEPPTAERESRGAHESAPDASSAGGLELAPANEVASRPETPSQQVPGGW